MMRRITGFSLALGVVTMLVVAGGPGVDSAEAKGCSGGVRIDHPRDPGWATYCPPDKIAICDNQGDKHDTWVRYWKQGVGGNRLPPRGNDIMGPRWDPGTALISPRDTFGRRNGYGRRIPQYCTYESNLGFGPIAFSICVLKEGCSRVREL